MEKLKIYFRLIEKAWVQEHKRINKQGNSYKVSGYWRDDKTPIKSETWETLNLPRWKEIMLSRKNGSLVDLIKDVDELEEVLRGLRNVFRVNKDGWCMLPTADHGMYAGIEPGFYGHIARLHGQEEADRRISYFRAVVDCLVNPWELWRHPVGNGKEDGRVFLAGYRDAGNDSRTVVVLVGFADKKPLVWTIIPIEKANRVDKQRYGELLFKDYQ